MEDNKLMRKELASGARLALIFGIMNTLLNSLVSAIFAGKLNGNLASAIAISIVTVIALLCNRKKLPEGWFCAAKEKMDPRVILSFLGFFALYQLATKLLFRSGSEGLPGNSWSFVLYMGIMVPICEETIFRGIILGKYVKYGRVFALICTSILFGAYHMNLIQLVTGAVSSRPKPGTPAVRLRSKRSGKYFLVLCATACTATSAATAKPIRNLAFISLCIFWGQS